jgi:acyl-coenzyme A synthetase/AMP-(fatty) acid ligase
VINTHLYAGASIVLTEKSLFQREFWQLFQEYKVTSLNGVPYTYEMLNKLRFFKRDLPHLRTLTQAGGKLNKELHKKFAEYAEKNGKRFFVMYGAAEAASRMGYLPYRDSLKKCGSMGIAIPGGRFELVDETGGAIEGEGQIGELVYYGRNVMLGYAERGEDLCRGDECHGRLCTGDLAVRDADGYYTVVGRKKRFLKIFGKRVNLSETEDLLKIKFPDLEIACAGIDDRVYIFTTDSRFLDEITDFISAKLALHRSAFKATYIEEIPKNKAGKTSYKELEKYYD